MRYFLFFLFCVTNLVESASLDSGGAGSNSKFAIIDLKKVAANSFAGKSIEEQIFKINDKAKEDLINFENTAKKIDFDEKNGEGNERIARERQAEDFQVVLYEMTRKKRYQIQNAYKIAIEALEKEIRKVVQEIAKEREYALIVISDAVVYNSDECSDITQETINRLDGRLKTIKVELKELRS